MFKQFAQFAAIAIAAMSLIVIQATAALAAEDANRPVVVESISRMEADQHLGQSWTISVPTAEKDAWVFTYDNRERVGIGYRTKLFGGNDIIWQRFIVSANDLTRDWQLQAQTLAATKNYSGLLSLQFTQGQKPQIFTDPRFRLAGDEKTTLWLQTQYFGPWDDLFDVDRWRIGSELETELGHGIKAKLRYTIGSTDKVDEGQLQIWIIAPIGE